MPLLITQNTPLRISRKYSLLNFNTAVNKLLFLKDVKAIHQLSDLVELSNIQKKMRIKIRSPTGTQVLTFTPEATVSSLLEEIRSKTSLSGDLDIKFGYPPKALILKEHPSDTLLKDLPIKLEGEQLIISESGGGTIRGSGSGVVKKSEGTTIESGNAGVYVPQSSTGSRSDVPFSFSGQGSASLNSSTNNPPLTLSRSLKPKINKDDPPDVPLKNGRGTIVLRVMEDDNSCLFRAISVSTLEAPRTNVY